MSQTDFLGINNHKLFKQLAKSISTDHNKTINIIAERQGVLYAWNKEDSSVLTLNIKAARDKDESAVNYQTLLPHSPPYFTPERLLVNETNTILIAAGPNGVLVFEIPERTPPCGNFAKNKEVIYCRTYSLLENILSFSSTVECRQVRFHPGSPTDSHFLVLTSDNVIRLLSLQNSSISDLATYSLGPKPRSNIPDQNLSFLDAFGDMAVDFDFSSPTIGVSKQPKSGASFTDKERSLIGRGDGEEIDDDDDELIWPIFILYGNGLVSKMVINYNGEKCHPGLQGPLNFKDFPTGNLADFCSIMCVPCMPSIIVIAHCDGNLYHALELPINEENQEITSTSFQHQDVKQQSYSKPVDSELYLFEIMEVELGLTSCSTSDVNSKNYTCPIFLYRDLSRLGSYYATHNTGVHSVNMQAVEDLSQFLNTDDDSDCFESIFNKPSCAKYLICTKTDPKEKINPVLGISIVSEPHGLISFLANGNVITLGIKDEIRKICNVPEKTEEVEESVGLNLSSSLINQTTPFDVQIENILKQSSTQPILQADTKNSEPSQEVCYEVFQRASKIFREEHFVNLKKAREEIEKRSKQLNVLETIQASELKDILKERETLQTNAENIAEKYEDLKEKQEEVSKRCQMLLAMVPRKQSKPSIAEEKYAEKLQTYEKKIDGFFIAIEKLKDKIKYQRNQMVNWKRENQKPEQLHPGQREAIRQNLSDTTKSIAEITDEVKDCCVCSSLSTNVVRHTVT